MSQQRRPTLADIELQWHDAKTNYEALGVGLVKELKMQLGHAFETVNSLEVENKKLRDKYEPKKKDKSDK